MKRCKEHDSESETQTTGTFPGILPVSILLTPIVFLPGCNNQPVTSKAPSHITRAATYAEQRQYRSAMIEIRNAIQAEPNNVSHIVALAEIYQTICAYGQIV